MISDGSIGVIQSKGKFLNELRGGLMRKKIESIQRISKAEILKEKGQYGILYKWSEPTEEIRSQYGHITIKKWMEKENERINKKGGVAKVIGLNGKIALFVK